MKFNDFSDKLCENAVKYGIFDVTVGELTRGWQKFKVTKTYFKSARQARSMRQVVTEWPNVRLKYRNMMANEGYELTPRDVDMYISVVEIAIEEYLNTCVD